MSNLKQKPVVMVVMDGWGVAPKGPHNALTFAKTPVLSELEKTYPYTEIDAQGLAVGLPEGQMGNSEVGHLNLGAGRVVKQDLVMIDDAVKDGSFAKNPAFLDAADKILKAKGRAHLMGLCSPGGVHSSLEHLYALAALLHQKGLKVFVHAVTDGRDTPPRSARQYMVDIEKNLKGTAEVSQVVGRFYSMDRDNRWDRVERGYRSHVLSEGTPHKSADEAIAAAYEAGENDEFITPRIIVDANGNPKGQINDNDGVFFFNFRADRAREITRALAEENFTAFARPVKRRLSAYVMMTQYQKDFPYPVAFPPASMDNILGEVLSKAGLTQLRCAETEKYAHVTFFFNGGVEAPFEGEDRQLVPSPKEVATYDLKPEMSAPAVCDKVVAAIESEKFNFILVNFANGDMVGHTGIMEAAVHAAETVDVQIGRILSSLKAVGGVALITADHGNLEKMWDDESNAPHTAHTNNPVPVIIVGDSYKGRILRKGGSLQDAAPTILDMLGLPKPAEMTGVSLIEKK
jgi:2,3-bisphosphoglycerate-independent phosphoglycerate mutase